MRSGVCVGGGGSRENKTGEEGFRGVCQNMNVGRGVGGGEQINLRVREL